MPKLVEAVSKQLNVRFLYSADLANRQVTIYTPARLPKSALPILLGSLLKGENLVVVDSDVPGWKRIVDIADMTTYAATGEASEILARDGPAAAVTQVIPVRNADISKLTTTFRKFLSTGANFIPIPENRLIIVTDYAQNVKTMVELLKLIDDSTGQSTIDFYETENRTPASLIEQVEALIAKSNATTGANDEVKLFNDASGRRVIVAGDETRVDESDAAAEAARHGHGLSDTGLQATECFGRADRQIDPRFGEQRRSRNGDSKRRSTRTATC